MIGTKNGGTVYRLAPASMAAEGARGRGVQLVLMKRSLGAAGGQGGKWLLSWIVTLDAFPRKVLVHRGRSSRADNKKTVRPALDCRSQEFTRG